MPLDPLRAAALGRTFLSEYARVNSAGGGAGCSQRTDNNHQRELCEPSKKGRIHLGIHSLRLARRPIYFSGATSNFLSMPLVATSVLFLVLQQATVSAPQLVHL